MNLPTISIVTPSLNQGRYIRTAIRSILAQEYAAFEYIVMDGGSEDDSCLVASEFVPRLTLVSERDEGQSDAINKGFARVTGEVIGWLNADDYYADGTLATVAQVFSAHPDVALVYGNAAYVNERGQHLGPAVHVESFSRERLVTNGNFIVQPAAFFRRSAFEAVGGLRKDLNWTMDYDLWIRLTKHFTVCHIDDSLAYVRCYTGTKTASGGRRRLAEVERMIKSHGGRGLPALFRLEAAAIDAREAHQLCGQGKYLEAVMRASTAFGRIATSPRAISALASPHTWRLVRAARYRDSHLVD